MKLAVAQLTVDEVPAVTFKTLVCLVTTHCWHSHFQTNLLETKRVIFSKVTESVDANHVALCNRSSEVVVDF